MKRPPLREIVIAVVGQVPPPLHGQSVMVSLLLSGDYAKTRLIHVPMPFSRDIGDIGRITWRKPLLALGVLFDILKARTFKKAQVLYYPPAGPNHVPVVRDLFLLILTRWMFRYTIFHFHAGGLKRFYDHLPALYKFFFRLAYFRPSIAIRNTSQNPEDTAFMKPKREFLIPNGIPDPAGHGLPRLNRKNAIPNILYVGMLREDKGVLVLIRACILLWRSGLHFRLNLVGEFASDDFRGKVSECIGRAAVSEKIAFHGVLERDAKWDQYRESDIFCFPSFFSAETFGLVLLEALSFSLPIVCTSWRGIPEVVDERCALMVPVRDEQALAESLRALLLDPGRCREMGTAGRERFLTYFTDDKFFQRFQMVFDHLRISSSED